MYNKRCLVGYKNHKTRGCVNYLINWYYSDMESKLEKSHLFIITILQYI